MHTTLFFTAITLFVLPLTSSAEGINCHGSSPTCELFTPDPGFEGKITDRLMEYINQLPNDKVYPPGVNIICIPGWWPQPRIGSPSEPGLPGNPGGIDKIPGGVCAFLQGGSPAKTGWEVKYLMGALRDHGCKACGSVPVTWPGDNNIKNGMLTSNFVSNPKVGGCKGVC